MAILKDKAYESAYSTEISNLIDKVTNREAFEYDPANDAAYKSLAKEYGRLGDEARTNTLADVAMNTGGLASSWAVTAANQAQNQYNQALTDKIPALMEAAYGRYQNELNNDMNMIGMLQGLDDSAYNRFSDQRNYDYQLGRDQVADNQWQMQFGYNQLRDQIADQQWQSQFDYAQNRDQVADNQWQTEHDFMVKQQEYENKFNEQEAQYEKMLTSWNTLGYATKEVAKFFGVKEGTKTSDERYAAASLALDQAQQALSREKFEFDKAQAEADENTNPLLKKYAPSQEVEDRIARMGSYFIHATDDQKILALEAVISDKSLSAADKEYIFEMFGL